MSHLTAKAMHDLLTQDLKRAIDLDVEIIKFVHNSKAKTVTCQMHFKNGFMVEGASMMVHQGLKLTCEDTARRVALAKVITIQQYLLAEKLYREALSAPRETLK